MFKFLFLFLFFEWSEAKQCLSPQRFLESLVSVVNPSNAFSGNKSFNADAMQPNDVVNTVLSLLMGTPTKRTEYSVSLDTNNHTIHELPLYLLYTRNNVVNFQDDIQNILLTMQPNDHIFLIWGMPHPLNNRLVLELWSQMEGHLQGRVLSERRSLFSIQRWIQPIVPRHIWYNFSHESVTYSGYKGAMGVDFLARSQKKLLSMHTNDVQNWFNVMCAYTDLLTQKYFEDLIYFKSGFTPIGTDENDRFIPIERISRNLTYLYEILLSCGDGQCAPLPSIEDDPMMGEISASVLLYSPLVALSDTKYASLLQKLDKSFRRRFANKYNHLSYKRRHTIDYFRLWNNVCDGISAVDNVGPNLGTRYRLATAAYYLWASFDCQKLSTIPHPHSMSFEVTVYKTCVD